MFIPLDQAEGRVVLRALRTHGTLARLAPLLCEPGDAVSVDFLIRLVVRCAERELMEEMALTERAGLEAELGL